MSRGLILIFALGTVQPLIPSEIPPVSTVNPRLKFDRFLLSTFYVHSWSYLKLLCDILLKHRSTRQDAIHLFFVAMSHLLLKIHSIYGMVLPVPQFMEKTIPELYKLIVPSEASKDLSQYSGVKWGRRTDVIHEASQTEGWSNIPIILFIVGVFIYRKNDFIQVETEKTLFHTRTCVDLPITYLPKFRVGPSWLKDDEKLHLGFYELIMFLLYDLPNLQNTSELYTVLREAINWILWETTLKNVYKCIQNSFSDPWASLFILKNGRGENPYKQPEGPEAKNLQAASKSKQVEVAEEPISEEHTAEDAPKQDLAPHEQAELGGVQQEEAQPISEEGRAAHEESIENIGIPPDLSWDDVLFEEHASKLLTEPDEDEIPTIEGGNNVALLNESQDEVEMKDSEKDDGDSKMEKKKCQRELLALNIDQEASDTRNDAGRSKRAITTVTPYSSSQLETEHEAIRKKPSKKPRTSTVVEGQVDEDKPPDVRRSHSLRPPIDTRDTPWYWHLQDTDQCKDLGSVQLSINDIQRRQHCNLYRLAYSWIVLAYAKHYDFGDGEELYDLLTRPTSGDNHAKLQWKRRLLLLHSRCNHILHGKPHDLGEFVLEDATTRMFFEQYFDNAMDTGYPLKNQIKGEEEIDPKQAQVTYCWTEMDEADATKYTRMCVHLCIHKWKSQVMFDKMILDYFYDNVKDSRMRTDAAFNIRGNAKVYPNDILTARQKLVWEEVFHSVVFRASPLDLTPSRFEGAKRNMTFLDYLVIETDKLLQAHFKPYQPIGNVTGTGYGPPRPGCQSVGNLDLVWRNLSSLFFVTDGKLRHEVRDSIDFGTPRHGLIKFSDFIVKDVRWFMPLIRVGPKHAGKLVNGGNGN